MSVGDVSILPRHIAIIMDGNGRWARRRALPRHAGHRAGVAAVRKITEECTRRGIEVLTLFAFSSENWRRPRSEVGLLMDLFMKSLQTEIESLHANKVRLRFVGDLEGFVPALVTQIHDAEALTRTNTGLTLVIAVGYGGRWDIVQAARSLAEDVAAGVIRPDDIDEAGLAGRLSIGDLPEPDLFIRTAGEHRISNFLLWSLAYTELHFTDTLWPDFDAEALDAAIADFSSRQRRFGRTPEQLEQPGSA